MTFAELFPGEDTNCRMIFGASHITLGCSNIDAAVASLRDYGYRPEFIDRNVINNASKLPILTENCDVHGIALLRSEQGFPIELVWYRDRMPEGVGRYIGVFETTAPALSADDVDFDESFSGLRPSVTSMWDAGTIAGLDAPAFFVKGAQTNAGLRQVVLPVTDVERASRFWCDMLGFAAVNKSDDLVELHFTSPVSAWRFGVFLAISPPRETRSALDDRGMACLSLLSSNVVDDVARLTENGAELLTDVFPIAINQRNMRVAILADPDGAFIELLQIFR